MAVAQLPLTRKTPPEPSAFVPSSARWSPDDLSRPIHVAVFYAVLAVLQHNSRHHAWAYALHVVFMLLPLAWTLGFLSQTTALVSWALEQYNTVALGGSPAASDRRLAASVAAGTVAFVITFVLLDMDDEDALLAATTFAAASGSLLSFDWPDLLRSTFASMVRVAVGGGGERERERGVVGGRKGTRLPPLVRRHALATRSPPHAHRWMLVLPCRKVAPRSLPPLSSARRSRHTADSRLIFVRLAKWQSPVAAVEHLLLTSPLDLASSMASLGAALLCISIEPCDYGPHHQPDK